jgi:hypothetical protein
MLPERQEWTSRAGACRVRIRFIGVLDWAWVSETGIAALEWQAHGDGALDRWSIWVFATGAKEQTVKARSHDPSRIKLFVMLSNGSCHATGASAKDGVLKRRIFPAPDLDAFGFLRGKDQWRVGFVFGLALEGVNDRILRVWLR